MRFKYICFLFLGILSSCAPKASVEQKSVLLPKEEPSYLFTIQGEPVLAEEFLYALSKNQHLKAKKEQWLTKEEFEQNFELFLNFKLKVKEAEKRGMDQTEEFNNEFSIIKEDLKKPYLLKNSIQEGELRKAYSRTQEILKASHILIKFPPKATYDDSIAVLRMAVKLKDRAESGADFNELAYEYSDDPSAKSNKGDLGYFTALQMVYPFEDAAFGLEVGEISNPVLTDFGYHIIKLEDRRPNPGEIRVSHILVRIDPSNPASEDRAKRRVSDIYSTLQSKDTIWEEVVRAYSEDQGTKDSGGKLPWFGVGAIVPEFEKVAFSLTEIGEISRPVKTPYGFHIIRLEETKPVASYEELEAFLKSKILRDSRSGFIQSQVLAMQMARYGFKENESVLTTLRPMVNDRWAEGMDVIFANLAELNLLDSALMIIEEDTFTVRSLAEFIQENKEVVKVGPGDYFDPWYDKFKEISLNKKEEYDLLNNNEEYRRLVQEYREGILLFSLMNDLVWQKALLDSTGQVAYYESHLDRYQWPDRVPALIIKMADDTLSDKVREFLADMSYQSGLKPILEDQFLVDHPLLLTLKEGIYNIEGQEMLEKIDVSKKKHELVHDGSRYFILLGEVIPAGPKAFEEIRGKVIQDYQKHLDLELIRTLKQNYRFQINQGEKERISNIVVKK